MVRALRFLEGFLQRDALQKAAFLKDLEGLWTRCDARVLRYRVLPPLLAESRNEALQPVILPLLMRIVQQQDPQVGDLPAAPAIWLSHKKRLYDVKRITPPADRPFSSSPASFCSTHSCCCESVAHTRRPLIGEPPYSMSCKSCGVQQALCTFARALLLVEDTLSVTLSWASLKRLWELQDFADYTLPALAPLCATASGQALFQLTRFADTLYQVMLPQSIEEVLLPLLARAADHGEPG